MIGDRLATARVTENKNLRPQNSIGEEAENQICTENAKPDLALN
jgi:hypothetical protein